MKKHSSQLGGEIQAVETVIQTLTSQPSHSPDSLVARLTPLFGQREDKTCYPSFFQKLFLKFLYILKFEDVSPLLVCVFYFIPECKVFVLRLWKFLHTVALQKQHTILDSAVDELTPLHQSAVSFLMSEEAASDKGAVGESFADKIQVCHYNSHTYPNSSKLNVYSFSTYVLSLV